jgi:hypothetical protein
LTICAALFAIQGNDRSLRGNLIGRTKCGVSTKLNAATDADRRPLRFFMTACWVSDYTGATELLESLLSANWLLADRGNVADRFRQALKDKGIGPASPAGSLAASPSSTTNAATNDATGARSWLGG